ncbi:3-beta hydroxysteroid dehydrogenase/isomerase family-domain-containing protein [Irpex lacteus]|nr:3-beta hydroxysteroid dehydrogenase/isomerase family-domain-containing protein [Irpex lacteus]
MAAHESFLVTGGSGLLGQHIVNQLLASKPGATVAVFDLAKPLTAFDKSVRVFTGDITDRHALETAVQEIKATCIFHTIAVLPGPPRDVHLKVNVGGTENVISVALAQGVQKLVYTSSASVVFDGHDQAGVDETAPYPPVPFDYYNETKAIAEQSVLSANGRNGLATASLRVAGLFGPGDRLTIPGFMNVLVTGKTGVQIGNNTNLFDWTYIENAAHAHLLAADRLSPSHPKFSQVAGQAFFISNNDPRPYWDFPRALWKAAGHTPSRITVLPKPIAMIIAILMEFFCWLTGREALLTRFRVTYVCLTRWCNTSKAREALDYEPPVPLNEGIKRSVEFWQKYQAPPPWRKSQ